MIALKKWFTLVELIVVITILAILWTIAFFALQGYTGDARNSKRTSDMANIQSAIATSVTQGKSVMSYPKNDNSNDSRVASISVGWSTPILWTEYEAGHINYSALWLKVADFSDPLSNSAYYLWATSRAGGKYEVATTIEKGATRIAKITGEYIPRNTSSVSGVAHTGAKIFVITNTKNISKFMIGDTLTWGKIITNISPNRLTRTVNSAFATAQSSIALAAVESPSLLDRSDVPQVSGNNYA